jgi:hypothetical protein
MTVTRMDPTMSRVSYFQRFSQAENHATNDTLLVLRYFYQSSPFKIQRALTELVEKDLSIGLSFQQQVRGEQSVPDALITQEPLHIYVETKRGGQLDADQVQRHIRTIAKSGARGGEMLIGITKEQIAEVDHKALAENAAAQGIAFAAVTFSQVAETLRRQCAPHESELLATEPLLPRGSFHGNRFKEDFVGPHIGFTLPRPIPNSAVIRSAEDL